MSEKQKAALDALADLPQDRRDQALQGMEFLAIGYQMGLDAAGKQKTEESPETKG